MDWSESGYLALSALNVKDGYIDFSQDVHYGNQELYDKWMSGKELHRGQVLFTTEAPMGNVAQVPDNKGYSGDICSWVTTYTCVTSFVCGSLDRQCGKKIGTCEYDYDTEDVFAYHTGT